MNEEEKKALAFLRFYVSDDEDEYFDRDYYIDKNIIETILNLIEKQQKQIEELKEKYSKKLIEFQKEREWYEKNHISKDKIIEKIEEITSYAYTSAEERDSQDYAIQVLKEILGG